MKRHVSFLLAGMLLAAPLNAALPVGAQAPDFRTTGALAGKPFKLHLKDQLRHGPLVLYFFPKAFTQGCTLEAKAFADAMPEFRKAARDALLGLAMACAADRKGPCPILGAFEAAGAKL